MTKVVLCPDIDVIDLVKVLKYCTKLCIANSQCDSIYPFVYLCVNVTLYVSDSLIYFIDSLIYFIIITEELLCCCSFIYKTV